MGHGNNCSAFRMIFISGPNQLVSDKETNKNKKNEIKMFQFWQTHHEMIDIMHNFSDIFLILCTIFIIMDNKMLTIKKLCANIDINQT